MYEGKSTGLVELHPNALILSNFNRLLKLLNVPEIERQLRAGRDFYKSSFWLGKGEEQDELSLLIGQLASYGKHIDHSGVEWWLSVLSTDKSPYWLMDPHFDRHDINEYDSEHMINPELASVFFLNTVDYGELVVMDQYIKDGVLYPPRVKCMEFIEPMENLYCKFPGKLKHGVIGRMWRQKKIPQVRITIALNYWKTRPYGDYIFNSAEYDVVLERWKRG